MKARQSVALLLIIVVTLFAGGLSSAAFQSAPMTPDEVSLTEIDAGEQIQLEKDQFLVVNLDSNPATGYRWMVQDMDGEVLKQADETFVASKTELLGAPQTQILRFEAVSAGETTLNLVYRRPWEKDIEPLDSFSVEVETAGAFEGVMSPFAEPDVVEDKVVDDDNEIMVPSSYNWCNEGGCTPVKNQGSCGSCWAFGTVGPLESQIKIQDGATKDLAEQYLVSCNTDGWGCDGGWWAHDYHEWKYPSGEPGPGAVYEADFPYTATDSPCNPPHTHHETIENWVYVSGENSVPSTSALKQAIYDHGPVAVAVCVNSAFQNYDDGVFSGPSCTSVNHAVVLVGWNDSDNAWILRNSWGSGWGESGYMRIAYGTSRVGYGANYIDYDGGGGPGPGPEPPCTDCDHYTGNLTGSGDYEYQPNGNYYYSSSGTHEGWLEGATGTDFDLYLWKWSSWYGWRTVASSTSASSSEHISYYGSSGYYVWRIYSYSGSGDYDFWLSRP